MARPERRVPPFLAFGAAGFVVGGLTGVAVAAMLGLGTGTVLAMFGLAVVTYLVVAAVAAAVAGEPVLVFYHHFLALGLVLVVALRWWDQPVLSYLDVFAVAMMAFLAVARIGCLTVGCCHGRPHHARSPLGTVVYTEAHASEGFAPHLVGVPLYPVQAAESAGVALLALAGVAWAAFGSPAPGSLLALVAVGYALLRFRVEDLRGDPGRIEWFGLRQAHWTSLAVAVAVALAGFAGALPARWWPAVAAAGLAIIAVRRVRRRPGPWDAATLLHPDHVHEVAERLADADDHTGGTTLALVATSRGVRLSTACGVDDHGRTVAHVTLSSTRPDPMPAPAALVLGHLLGVLRQAEGGAVVVDRGNGVYQVVLAESPLP